MKIIDKQRKELIYHHKVFHGLAQRGNNFLVESRGEKLKEILAA